MRLVTINIYLSDVSRVTRYCHACSLTSNVLSSRVFERSVTSASASSTFEASRRHSILLPAKTETTLTLQLYLHLIRIRFHYYDKETEGEGEGVFVISMAHIFASSFDWFNGISLSFVIY